MDDRKRIRKALIIANIPIVILPIAVMYYYRDIFFVLYNTYTEAVRQTASNLFVISFFFAIGFTFADVIVLGYIYTENKDVRLKTAQQKRNEENRIRVEREQQVERQKQRERKLELLKDFETSGRYEEAARICDELGMLEKAGEMRRLEKTSYHISASFSMGQNGAISCKCPTCGSSQVIASKSNTVKCEHCGNNYIIPKKVLDLL